ncbi:MAG TPA: hypothetical protein VGV59_14770 [Pyrinomonadaceae bacterium]|nr:hypothetical protein [Pyrinomonadaceae bacterium]
MADNTSFQKLNPAEENFLLLHRDARSACLDFLGLLKVILAPFSTTHVFPMMDYQIAEQVIDEYLDKLPQTIKDKMRVNKASVIALKDEYLAPSNEPQEVLQQLVDEYVEALIDQYTALQPKRTATTTSSAPSSRTAPSAASRPAERSAREDYTPEYKSKS